MIPKTYYDDNPDPDDRRYVDDYWSWLREQPQDAWLLWARWANWDSAERIFQAMLDSPDCDPALVSWLFWGCDPAAHVDNPHYYSPDSLIWKIIGNVERSHYSSSAMYYDRFEVGMRAHRYIQALRRASPGQAPFKLPRVLCGPFNGRPATISSRYDDRTEQDLAEMFHYLDGGLPRTEDEHCQRRGREWLADQMRLPDVPQDPIATYRHHDDASYLEALFGKSRDFEAALDRHRKGIKPRKGWWPFG